jgi:hypothetical protein
MDNEAAENAEEVIQFCNSIGVIVRNFPAYLGHLLNVCDNPIHATVQRNVDKAEEVISKPFQSLYDKYSAFVDAYTSITPDEVLNSLLSIGFGKLVSIKEAEACFQRTLSEGLPNQREQHVVQLEEVLNDCIDNVRPIPKSPYEYRLAGPSWDTYYDLLELESEMNSS